jgi:HAE1 family hydrophobic/amphiphilic exporter-1
MTGTAITLAWVFLPEAEYLPEGNRNLGIGILLPPPGYSIDELLELGEEIESNIAPYLYREPARAEQNVAEAAARREEEAGSSASELDVEIRHFFFVARENNVFMGAVATEPSEASRLVPVLQRAVRDIPGLISVVQQASLFERGTSTGRRVDIEITGPDLGELIRIGGEIFGRVMQHFPLDEGHQARPIPSLDLQTPEIHILPDRERARDLGLDARDIGVTVDAIIDGAKASDFQLEGREIDLSVIGRELEWNWKTQELADIPISTPEGKLVSLGSVSRIEITRGPQQINHVERNRSITIQLIPSSAVPLETAVRTIRTDIVEPMMASGAVTAPYQIELAGTADELYEAFTAFQWNFLLAVLITYLLMAALFESFLYPLVVLFSIPLAAVGGVLCLGIVHAFAPTVRLDILTMLGFVILVGVVVNNAILLVYQTLQGIRDGVPLQEAVIQAVHSRFRPILMTTLTSLCGMLPLVLSPGAGSELYRGLGSVVVGGIFISAVFTLYLIPALLGLVLMGRRLLVGSAAGGSQQEGPA